MLRGWPRGCQGQGWLRIGSLGGALLVEPHLLHAAPTVDRMVRDQVLHVRPRREVVESPDERRAHGCRFELPVDLLHQRYALLRIRLLGLLVDEPRVRVLTGAGRASRRPRSPVITR